MVIHGSDTHRLFLMRKKHNLSRDYLVVLLNSREQYRLTKTVGV